MNPPCTPNELSVGQCQRASLLRALVAQPAAVLADEPTSALDVTTAAGVLHLLRNIADRGTAVVVVSHDEAMLAVLADRTLRMRDGRLAPAVTLRMRDGRLAPAEPVPPPVVEQR